MGLSSVSTTLSAKEVIGTLEKIKGFIPKDEYKDLELKSNQITVDLTKWMGNRSFQPNLEKIKEAFNNNYHLSFEYIGGKGKRDERTIEPYKLTLKEGSWYLQGYCLLREDYRIFKLSRITNLKIDEKIFERREFIENTLDGSEWIQERIIIIKLVVDWSLREVMIERCGEENIREYKDDKYIVDFPFVEDDYGYNILMGFGSRCECIEPKHVREELLNRIRKIMDIYKK